MKRSDEKVLSVDKIMIVNHKDPVLFKVEWRINRFFTKKALFQLNEMVLF